MSVFKWFCHVPINVHWVSVQSSGGIFYSVHLCEQATPTGSAPKKNRKWGRGSVWHTHSKCTKEQEVGKRFSVTHSQEVYQRTGSGAEILYDTDSGAPAVGWMAGRVKKKAEDKKIIIIIIINTIVGYQQWLCMDYLVEQVWKENLQICLEDLVTRLLGRQSTSK